jgi:hypothetical protein
MTEKEPSASGAHIRSTSKVSGNDRKDFLKGSIKLRLTEKQAPDRKKEKGSPNQHAQEAEDENQLGYKRKFKFSTAEE